MIGIVLAPTSLELDLMPETVALRKRLVTRSRNMTQFGALLMGFGGVTALGCTVGQGISGLSTLAIGWFIATAAIMAGSVAMLKYTLWREERDA